MKGLDITGPPIILKDFYKMEFALPDRRFVWGSKALLQLAGGAMLIDREEFAWMDRPIVRGEIHEIINRR